MPGSTVRTSDPIALSPEGLVSFSFFFFFKIVLFIFREEKGRGKERRETSVCGCLSSIPHWGPSLHPRHVSQLGIELATLWFTGWHSTHWATPARAEGLVLMPKIIPVWGLNKACTVFCLFCVLLKRPQICCTALPDNPPFLSPLLHMMVFLLPLAVRETFGFCPAMKGPLFIPSHQQLPWFPFWSYLATFFPLLHNNTSIEMLRLLASYFIKTIKLMAKKKKKNQISLSLLLPGSNPAGLYILFL